MPRTSEFFVFVELGATGVLEGSILTNLPSKDGSTAKPFCSYDTVVKKIGCINVGGF